MMRIASEKLRTSLRFFRLAPSILFGAELSFFMRSWIAFHVGPVGNMSLLPAPFAHAAVVALSLKAWMRFGIRKDAEYGEVRVSGQVLAAGWAFLLACALPALPGMAAGKGSGIDPESALAAAGVLSALALFTGLTMRSAHAADRAAKATQESEMRVKTLQAEVRSARREADDYIHAAAHDLQAPLRHISGFVQLLFTDKGNRSEPEREKFTRYILDGIGRMTGMISGLVELGKLGKADPPANLIGLSPILKEAAATLKGEIELEGGSVSIPSDLPVVAGSEALLGKLALALLRNCSLYRTGGVLFPFAHQAENRAGIDGGASPG